MLLRTVDKHLICTVFTAPIILDIVIFLRKAPCKNLTYVKKITYYYYTYIITELLWNLVPWFIFAIFFKEILIYYSSAFFRRVYLAAILYSIASCNIFINFSIHFNLLLVLPTYNTQNISSYYITPQFDTLTHYLYIYVKKISKI